MYNIYSYVVNRTNDWCSPARKVMTCLDVIEVEKVMKGLKEISAKILGDYIVIYYEEEIKPFVVYRDDYDGAHNLVRTEKLKAFAYKEKAEAYVKSLDAEQGSDNKRFVHYIMKTVSND